MVEHCTMLLNSVALIGLKHLLTVPQIVKELLLKSENLLLMAHKVIHSAHYCTVSKPHNGNANIIMKHVIQCGPIKVTEVRCQYGLVNA